MNRLSEDLESRILPASFVQVAAFDLWNGGIVPSTDAAGIAYNPDTGTLVIADSEINELPLIFDGNNIFQTSLSGNQLVGSFASGNEEPTGITYNIADGFFYVTNDSDDSVTRYGSDL